MLNIYIGNNLENLIDVMRERLYDRVHPLKKPVVCVQTSGMQRWIGLKLAEKAGISANLDYLFPAALIKRLAERHFGAENLWTDRQELTWALYSALTKAEDNGKNSELISYMENDPHKIKTFRLAQKISDIFDQYQIYRPEMVMDWLSAGTHDKTAEIEGWQPWLFNEVFPDTRRCKTSVLHRYIKDCEKGKADFTETVHLFGISVIPRFFMDVLFTVSAKADINLYLLCPSVHYWGDSISDREISRAEKRTGKSRNELQLDQNHPLLDNLGIMGRDFFEYLTAYENSNIIERFTKEPDSSTLLGGIQAEIYDFTKQTDAKADDSIVINSCHNPLREVQTLYDFMLDTMSRDSSITPADILVMTPDIRKYAPYIRAVFDNPYSENAAIPYTIADIPTKTESRAANVFSELISALTGQFSLAAAVKLIESPVISGRFGITNVQNIADVLERNGAYWGLDSESHRKEGITADTPFTWDRAMRRLALGLAEGGKRVIYAEAAGADVPFTMAKQLGGLMRFIELCAHYSKVLGGEGFAAKWCGVLSEMADAFLSTDSEYADENVGIAKMIADISAESAGCLINMPFRPVYETLSGKLDEVKTAKGFITGKATFCAMMPMRSIPFRVICIMGLDDGAFPRVKTEPEFDLISAKPRKGDRTQRESDKYLFLETLISAKDRLCISFTGRSETDNRPLVPSITVTELVRHLSDRFESDESVTEHPLHSFSRKYFKNNEKLFTYSPERFKAAAAFGTKQSERNFCGSEIPAEIPSEISLAEFERFFMNPPLFFLKNTLGIDLSEQFEPLPETERLVLNGLQEYGLRKAATENMIAGKSADGLLNYALATAQLPAGGIGEGYRNRIYSAAVQITDAVTAHGEAVSLEADITVKGLRIKGRIDGVTADGLVYAKHGILKPKDLLKTWIRRLVLHRADNQSAAVMVDIKGEKTALPEVFNHEALETLVELFLKGLKSPLCFNVDAGYKALDSAYKKQYPSVESPDSLKLGHEFMLCFGRDGYGENLALNGALIFGALEKAHADK